MKIKYIENFCEHLKDNKLPDNVNQESMGVGETLYTADDWTIEICEFLIKGEERLECNYKQKMFTCLQEVKDDADVLCVGEVGRGLDILISQMVKEWEEIICYDHNEIYKEYLNRYFYYDHLIFHGISSSVFLDTHHDIIKEKTIMVMNHSKIRQFDVMKKNKNIVHLIFDGELLW